MSTGYKTPITINLGVSAFCSDPDIDRLIAHVDAALYKAKKVGHNCVVVEAER